MSDQKFQGTRLWEVVDAALDDLVENQDIQETTRREYIVGYLVKRLLEAGWSGTLGEGKRTVRELGGEIWAELRNRIAEEEADWRAKTEIVDVIMGVLARHSGKRIENDPGLPVTPLPVGPDR